MSAFGMLQKVGKSLMLPVSLMPIAGILLGVGAAKFSMLPPIVSEIMMNAGDAVFGNMALLFAIGVALGFTKNDGVAGLAAMFNRFYNISLPEYLGFFSGKPAVPIMTSFTAIFAGILLAFVWHPIGNTIAAFSH